MTMSEMQMNDTMEKTKDTMNNEVSKYAESPIRLKRHRVVAAPYAQQKPMRGGPLSSVARVVGQKRSAHSPAS